MRFHHANRFILFIAATVNISSAAELIDKTHYMRAYRDHEPRQVGVGAGVGAGTSPPAPAQPTLPSNYWWPYASWGATTTVMTATSSVLSLPTSMPTTYQVTSLPLSSTSLSSPVPTTDPSSNLTQSTSSEASTTSTSSTPSSTPTTTPQQATSQRPFNYMRFFIPIVAVIGGLVAAILLWLLCRSCIRRRNRTVWRTTSFSGRGRRDPEKGWRRYEEMHARRGWWSKLFSRREPVEEVVSGPRYVGVDDVNRPRAERGLLQSGGEYEYGEPLWAESNNADDELSGEHEASFGDQGPLLLSSQPKQAGRARTKLLRKPPSTTSSSRPPIMPSATSLAFLELYDSDSDDGSDEKYENEIPWESLRHKSIKRAILAKVDEEKKWTDSMRGIRAVKAALAGIGSGGDATVGRRQTHIRTDSDSCVVNNDGMVVGPSSTSTNRTRSTRTEGPGFQIMVESPPPHIPTPSKTWSLASSFPFLSNTSGGNNNQVSEEDRYTPTPPRMRSGSRSRGSTSPSKVRTPEAVEGNDINKLVGGRTRQSASRPPPAPSAAVLIRSPPHVMTPQMESALCFTPVPASISKMDTSFVNDGSFYLDTRTETLGTTRRKSISTQRTTGEHADPGINSRRPDPYHGRVSVPDSDTDGSVFTRTYRVRTDRAMRRVEAIVENGRSERGLVERVRVGSPTVRTALRPRSETQVSLGRVG